MRAADYDDWVTETEGENGRVLHGLNGDILVWNPVPRRRHELTKELCAAKNIHVLE